MDDAGRADVAASILAEAAALSAIWTPFGLAGLVRYVEVADDDELRALSGVCRRLAAVLAAVADERRGGTGGA